MVKTRTYLLSLVGALLLSQTIRADDEEETKTPQTPVTTTENFHACTDSVEAATFDKCPGSYDAGKMNNSWYATKIVEDDTTGWIGMYADTDADKYYFYMQFQPNNDDEWWLGASSAKRF